MRQLSARAITAVKCVLFALFCIPAVSGALRVGAQADPAAFLNHLTGEWTLRLLLLTLAITPLRMLTGANWLLRLRRMSGLFVFAYAFGHFCVYLFLDLQLDFSLLAEDIIERKYITVGFAAFVLLLPLAMTSNDISVRKLGGKLWVKIHRAVYVIGVLGILHYLWIKKGDNITGPIVHGLILMTLLSFRFQAVRNRLAKVKAKTQTQ